MIEQTAQRRYRLSIRAMMVTVAFCALLLAPFVWMFRHAEAMRLERAYAEHARAVAEERAAVSARTTQAALAGAKLGTAHEKKAGSLWAGLSVNHPIFKVGQTNDLRIEFTLVNDRDKPIDSKIADSQIIINGKELNDSGLILSSVQKGDRSNALPPGQSLRLDCLLGDRFKEPGIYRISWKGAGFQSSEIVIRILPKEAR
jgi:hypothetical protein